MGAENKLAKIGLGLPVKSVSDETHSYERFTQRPFYVKINRRTLDLIPPGVRPASVLDMATGTGGIIELLLSGQKLFTGGDGARISGIDIDGAAVKAARNKFTFPPSYGASFDFHVGSAENTGEKDDSFDLVTFCNAIHLTDVPASFREAHRVLEPGGIFVANSAFVDGVGYPTPDAEQLWRSLGTGAMLKARRAGYKTDRNTDFVNYKVEDYKGFAKAAGFVDIETLIIEAQMDVDDVLAICHYDEFATGVLRGVPLDTAHKVLQDAAREIFARLEKEGKEAVFLRNWMTMIARKPA